MITGRNAANHELAKELFTVVIHKGKVRMATRPGMRMHKHHRQARSLSLFCAVDYKARFEHRLMRTAPTIGVVRCNLYDVDQIPGPLVPPCHIARQQGTGF
jgi:hypothetical protein